LKTAIFIKESRKPVYITFDADPYSITFYASFLEIHHSMLLFDNPKRKTVSLPPGCLIIVRNKADLDKTLKRFGIKMPLPLNTEEYQKIYVRNLEGQ
jgi:hypothetical protein